MPKKRGQGEGALYYSESKGRWIAVLDLGRGPDGVRRRLKLHGATRAEARRRLEEAQKAAAAGLHADDQRTTVAEFCAYWLKHGVPASAQSPNTFASIEWAARVFAAGRSPEWDELSEDSLPGVFEHVRVVVGSLAGVGLVLFVHGCCSCSSILRERARPR